MELVSALCEDDKKKSSICGQVTSPIVSFAAVFRLVTEERCVTSLKTAAKETTSPTKLQNRSFQVVNCRKTGREIYLIEKVHLQSVQNCLLSTSNMEIFVVHVALVVMIT